MMKMSYWEERNQDWKEPRDIEIELIDYHEYIDIYNEEGEYLDTEARKLYQVSLNDLSKSNFLALIQLLEEFFLHPDIIKQFLKIKKFIKNYSNEFIEKAIQREESLRKNCHNGGRKNKVQPIIEEIQANPERKYEILLEASLELSRASIGRIKKATKDISIHIPTWVEKAEKLRNTSAYFMVKYLEMEENKQKQRQKIAFDRMLS